ncbi:MAG: MBL fold metallo-hydrolase [Lachnospiraceae bacterium]|nr:MBL fold metallo-hydrolase [Lachnospiraceae bacterium]
MKLTFIGADHEVTGSAHLLTACGKNILIDCGMEQGNDNFINAEFPIPESQIDYVLLTHAHIDHSGMIPRLYVKGFRGEIWATKATCDLANIMLRDSAHIQEFEAEWRNRKAKRAGLEPYTPIYSLTDVEGVLTHFKSFEYGKKYELCEGVEVRFTDIGHLLGSASIEVFVKEPRRRKKCIVFSGDIGNTDQPLIKDPVYTEKADYVVMESTYGDRSHGEKPDYVKQLTQIIQRTFDRGGNVVIPSFAVGRTQELLYFIRIIKEKNLIERHADFEVYIDSPLAVEATTVFNKNIEDCFDEEALALVEAGINPIAFPGLKKAVTSDESRAINFDTKPKIIISASGMCEAGRIRHHLKHNLWRQECTIVFVGYQAYGTLGRSLLDGVKEVNLFGETIDVRADIVTLEGISGHADVNGLKKWIHAFNPYPRKVFVVHGEDKVCENFTASLDEEGYNAEAPYSGSVFNMDDDSWAVKAEPIPVEQRPIVSEGGRRAREIFERLMAAGQRLLTVISHNKGGTNKDLAKFTDQINSLCDKWDR